MPALITSLTEAQVAVHGRAALHGIVAPFRGVTLTLERQGTDGTFTAIADTTMPTSAVEGRFSFQLPTAVAGRSSYRLVVTGPGIEPTTGPVLQLGVVRARITRVSPTAREFVTVRNTGPIAIQLAGWRLRDNARKSLALPRFSLAPGTSVRIFTGTGHSTARRLFLGRKADMWGAARDTARLVDRSGALVARLRY